MGELVQVLVHTPHAEPLGVENTAVRSNTDTRVAQATVRAQNKKLFLVRTEGVPGHKTLLKQHNGSGVWWFLAVVCKRATQPTQVAGKCFLRGFTCGALHRSEQRSRQS